MPEDIPYQGKELELFATAKNWKKYISRQILPHIKGIVLEAGAGLGNMTHYLNTGSSSLWILAEPDKEMAGLLAEKINTRKLPENCSVINGTIEETGTRMFDTIIYIDVLEHIAEDKEEVKKAVTHLNPGGHLIILSPAYQFLYSPFDKEIGHFRRYSKKNLRNLATPALQPVTIKYLDAVGVLSSLANKLLLRQSYPGKKQVVFWDSYLVPCSVIIDRLINFSAGKSILGIWKKV